MKFNIAPVIGMLLLSIIFSVPIMANELAPCGTELSKEQREWLRAYQANPVQYKAAGEDPDYLPLKVHIVGTDEGTGYFATADVFRLVCEVNDQYTGSGMQFFISGDFNYINNDDYYDHNYFTGAEMMNQYNEPNVINMYIVDNPNDNCGYYSPGLDALAVAKSCSDQGSTTLAHELGHYFSLPHTFSGWEGAYEGDGTLIY